MSEVTIRYFVAEGDKAERVIKEGLEKVNAGREKRAAFMEKHGADGLFEYRHQPPYGLCFKADKCDGGKKPGFWSPKRLIQDGTAYYEYKFNKSSRIGKELIAEAKGLGIFDFSSFAVSKFACSRNCIVKDPGSRTGLSIYRTVAGLAKGKLVFKIPDDGKGGVVANLFPPEFRELKKSEFIALTEED